MHPSTASTTSKSLHLLQHSGLQHATPTAVTHFTYCMMIQQGQKQSKWQTLLHLLCLVSKLCLWEWGSWRQMCLYVHLPRCYGLRLKTTAQGTHWDSPHRGTGERYFQQVLTNMQLHGNILHRGCTMYLLIVSDHVPPHDGTQSVFNLCCSAKTIHHSSSKNAKHSLYLQLHKSEDMLIFSFLFIGHIQAL